MKRKIKILITLIMIISIIFPVVVFAVGDGNIDSGGSGMGGMELVPINGLLDMTVFV